GNPETELEDLVRLNSPEDKKVTYTLQGKELIKAWDQQTVEVFPKEEVRRVL
ncbi:hypothetical protein Tco_1521164, partial [Tanacetum coccineum]